ncbi:MAG TPA: T9SS type A sorting domain-containing protein [Chitinophagaceae bacterium]|nr:T9SS type A sorting domain-containing protein [Chitinophagaceae bacterium]HPH31854.1 T9SS type A sorting domain-containing protein [Chitinophagaceae bacterium]
MTWLRHLITLVIPATLFLINQTANAQCGLAPSSGTTTITAANTIVNSYYPGTGNPVSGTSSLVVGTINAAGSAATITAGDLILIIQMQGADINTGNTNSYGDGVSSATASGYLSTNLYAGYYEYANVASVAGTTINLTYPLINNYYTRAFSAGNSIRSYQVIRVPRYFNLTINASSSITAAPWNGSSGGVLVVDAVNVLTFTNSTSVITANGLGFRGGGGKNFSGATAGNTNGTGAITNTDYRWNSAATTAANTTGGSKGEGIAGTPRYIPNITATTTTTGTVEGYVNGSMGWGAPGNAGGGGTDGNAGTNEYNPGGGGGANGGAGGKGGAGWENGLNNPNTYPTGGYGGSPFAQYALSRVIMGGGGGSGTGNNSAPANEFFCSGASGGGVIIVRAGSYSGNGQVSANGAAATNITNGAQTDAAGGGGAGGTIILVTTTGNTGISNLTATATGGTGGDMSAYFSHGPGGGGGGGIIYTNGTLASSNVAGGANGRTRTCCSAANPLTDTWGSSPGANGRLIVLSSPPVLLNGAGSPAACGTLPVTLTRFKGVVENNQSALLSWQIGESINFRKFEVEMSLDGINYSGTGNVGYTPGKADYQFSQRMYSGVLYYFRLKLVDEDGSFKYSSIVTLRAQEIASESALVILTNPATAGSILKIKAGSNQSASLKIYDETGRLMRNKPVSLKAGAQLVEVPETNGLTPGTYLLQISIDQMPVSARLVKL